MLRLTSVWNKLDVGLRSAICKALGYEGKDGAKDYHALPNDLKEQHLFLVLIKRAYRRKKENINE